MRALALGLLLAFPSHAAELDSVKLVEQVLKVEIPDLPPEAVEAFLAVDGQALPKKLRKRFETRKLELYTAKQLAMGRKKSNWRIIKEDECSRPKEMEAPEVSILMLAGYMKILDDEEAYIEKKTNCTEKDMMCEFTLQIVLEKKRKSVRKIYFLHEKDPLMAYVAEYRAGMSGKNTNFFGVMKANCTR